MDELLHDADALREVASSFPEPAASWARALLAVWHGDLAYGLPTSDLLWDPVFAAAPPGLAEASRAALAGAAPPTEGLAATLAAAGTWGVTLGEPADVIAAARTHFGHGGAADLHLAKLLADHGELSPATLRVAAAASGADAPAGRAALAALTLRFAAAAGAGDDAAAAIVAGLHPDDVAPLLDHLGLALSPVPPSTDPEEAAAHGAGLAGGSAPAASARGGRKGRARALVAALTAGRDDALACVARALVGGQAPPPVMAALVAQLAWDAAYTPADPVDDALVRHAAHRPANLIAARAAGVGDRAAEALRRFREGNLCAGVLAFDADPDAAAPALLALALGWPSLLGLGLGAAALPRVAATLPDALRDPNVREGALALAPWAPTAAVRDALCELPAPHDPGLRRAYAAALAAMGSPDASARARATLATLPDGDHADIVRLLDALGG